MRLNKEVFAIALSIMILSGCSSTDEKDSGLLDDVSAVDNEKDTSTSGYSDGSLLSGEEFGSNVTIDARGLGPEFSDPTNPLSKGVIYFMYDSSQVRQDFIPVIAAHSKYLQSHPSQHIILEGHADERGSREYNIALGEQRAKSIFRMMKMQGVNSNQLEIVSYGEEKPEAEGMDEASWQQNRRVEVDYQGR
ncbi:MAG: peptidoglycan-associated lipoprotein Pal [Methylococcales bacterium]|nr:peptidoglycan-associated lipoprotein Pal [Methylococcales bacterium]